MIGVLRSENDADNYASERLFDFGLRWTRYLGSVEEDLSEFDLLLVPKYEFNEREVNNLLAFLGENGTVISLYPNEDLVSLAGAVGEVFESSRYEVSDHMLMFSKRVPVFGNIRRIEDSQSLIKMERLGTPAIAQKRFKSGSLYVYSFSLSDCVYSIMQHLVDLDAEGEAGKKWGDYPTNLLEKAGVIVDTPYADVQIMYLRGLIINELRKKGLLLPIIWHLPNAMKSCALITIDEDWASLSAVEYSLDMMKERNLPSTLFVTEKVDEGRESIFKGKCDLAVHPFYKERMFDEEVLISSMGFLPKNPKGARNHRRLVTRPDLFEAEAKHGLQWDSNYGVSESYGYGNGTGLPFFLWHDGSKYDLLEFPIHYEDDLFLFDPEGFDFNESRIKDMLELSREKFFTCLTFTFHPIHVFLNSSSISDYERFKQLGISKDEEGLREYRDSLKEKKGIRDLYISVLDYLRDKSDEILVSTCQEVNDHIRKNLGVDISLDDKTVSISAFFEGLTLLFPFADELELDKIEELSVRTVPLEVGGIQCVLAQVSSSIPEDGRIDIARECLSTSRSGSKREGE
jgi:hypothetical protein